MSRVRDNLLVVSLSDTFALFLFWLAKKLNISFQQIGKYEKGQNGLNAIRIVQISNLLKIPKSYLLENIELLEKVRPTDNSSVIVSESLKNV